MTPATRRAGSRLAALWLSQFCRILGDNVLRLFVVLEVAEVGGPDRDRAWHLTTALLAFPAIILAPVNGAICNSLPKRGVLIGTSALALLAVLLFGTTGGPWPACWAMVALAWLVYSPARYALLPAAATDTGIPLTRINGWIEMGSFLAVVGGLLLGGLLHAAPAGPLGLPAAILVAAGLNLLGLFFALPVRFASDVRRVEPATEALRSFFRDTRQILADAESGGSLLGLAALRGIVAGMMGAVVAVTLARPTGENTGVVPDLIRVALWILAGVAAGSLLAGVQGHPYRALGLVPLGALGLVAGLIWSAVVAGAAVPSGVCVFLGVMGGLINVPLAACFQASVPADSRGNAMAVRNLVEYVGMSVAAVSLYGFGQAEVLSPRGQLWFVAVLALAGAVAAWWFLFRPGLEQVAEWVLWPIYRIKGRGPGIGLVPLRGPVLVIANHSAYFDPLWVGKVVPRRLTAMMTSVFYDKPIMRWVMARVIHAIRVEASGYRRDVPELREAIATLDRGDCLVIFPEARLRRNVDVPLRQFGQGVWRILCERPNTPVVTIWIEGGWGSYLSYCGGPPGKNKRMDVWRPIELGVAAPEVLSAELLADQRATRAHLMRAVLENRKYLGLEPIIVSTNLVASSGIEEEA